jgi:hypothetical protein
MHGCRKVVEEIGDNTALMVKGFCCIKAARRWLCWVKNRGEVSLFDPFVLVIHLFAFSCSVSQEVMEPLNGKKHFGALVSFNKRTKDFVCRHCTR